MLELKNENLEIQIDSPGAVYNQSRFDWTGQISQIIFNELHHFCTTETNDEKLRSTRGIGLCNEFGISTPVGYDECPVGAYFLKIGTGMLLKESNEAYDFFKTYKVKPAEFKVQQENHSSVSIETKASDKRGYAYKFIKQYSITSNTLSIHCVLENVGSKDIITEEYCHNFLCIDKKLVDNSYRLSFDCKINQNDFTNLVNPNECMIVSSEGMTWQSIPESDFFISNVGKVASWKLENTKSKVSISESVDFVPTYCNLWGKGHVISPELFKEINIKPGQKADWTRKYTFNHL